MSIDLLVDGTLSTSTSGMSFSFSWDSTSVSNGYHTLMVRARDGNGNVGAAWTRTSVGN